MKKPYVIAEIGVNHYDTATALDLSPLEAAKLYICAAKEAGVDAVKFQSYKAETIVSKHSPAYWDTTKEPTPTQYQLFKKFDSFGEKEYALLARYCQTVGIDFMSTPFDYASADYLDSMMSVYKISSSDLTNLPFIRHIAKKKKPIYLSVGASYLSEIDEAIRAIQEEGNGDICLLHCVLSYPTLYQDANLKVIPSLMNIFNLPVGYSDHTLPDEGMSILGSAYLLGAQVIEKHFTLDKALPGNDHYHAGDPEDFKKAIHNFELISTAMGSGEKTVLSCEAVPRKEARRSLVLARTVPAGTVLGQNDLIAKRPGWGIAPKFKDVVVGRKTKQNLEEDTVLTWDMV